VDNAKQPSWVLDKGLEGIQDVIIPGKGTDTVLVEKNG